MKQYIISQQLINDINFIFSNVIYNRPYGEISRVHQMLQAIPEYKNEAKPEQVEENNAAQA